MNPMFLTYSVCSLCFYFGTNHCFGATYWRGTRLWAKKRYFKVTAYYAVYKCVGINVDFRGKYSSLHSEMLWRSSATRIPVIYVSLSARIHQLCPARICALFKKCPCAIGEGFFFFFNFVLCGCPYVTQTHHTVANTVPRALGWLWLTYESGVNGALASLVSVRNSVLY